MIPTPLPPLLIFPNQQETRNDAPEKKPQRKVSKHHTVAKKVPWFIFAAVDIRRYDTINVAPTNYKTESDTPFVHALDIVGAPGNCVCDCGWQMLA